MRRTFFVSATNTITIHVAVAVVVLGFSGCFALSRGEDNPCREAAALVMEREDLRQDLDSQYDYYRRREVLAKLRQVERELDKADAACVEYRKKADEQG